MKRYFFIFVISVLVISDILSQETPNLIPYRKGKKWGFCDRNKNIIIPIVYDDASPFREGLLVVWISGRWGFINKNGDIIIEPKYQKVMPFNNGLAAVTIENEGKVMRNWFYIDKKGNEYYEE